MNDPPHWWCWWSGPSRLRIASSMHNRSRYGYPLALGAMLITGCVLYRPAGPARLRIPALLPLPRRRAIGLPLAISTRAGRPRADHSGLVGVTGIRGLRRKRASAGPIQLVGCISIQGTNAINTTGTIENTAERGKHPKRHHPDAVAALGGLREETSGAGAHTAVRSSEES